MISVMKGSECESQIPGMIAWVGLHGDPGRTVMIGIKRIQVEMIRGGDEGFMIFWHSSLVGWIARWKQCV
jgi:hypothetical protein